MAKVRKSSRKGKARVTCFHCRTTWDLASAVTNRCPSCGWITEIYYDRKEAEKVAAIYNRLDPPLPDKAGVRRLQGIYGYSVSFFPDQDRLLQAAGEILGIESR